MVYFYIHLFYPIFVKIFNLNLHEYQAEGIC